MSDVVIRCENLGKKYRIGVERRARYTTLRDVIADGVRSWGRRLFGRASSAADFSDQEIWALKDVSVEVRRGERVGIIGRNGAGKSTLLKLLSRITVPTTGRIRLKGRVASLLEVGTGFHPELTGRENVFLNGAILGMKRTEVRRKFDEIVAFAEVEKFIATPVKHYSSGMYMRLAFAVAAHLEAELLIVDEVLAVGDSAFQQKCLGKMDEVASSGRTVLFVSHNMQAVARLCNRCLCLHAGQAVHFGSVPDGLSRYYLLLKETTAQVLTEDRRPGSGEVRFTGVAPEQESFRPDEAKAIRFQLRRKGPRAGPVYLSALVIDEFGEVVVQCDSRLVGCEPSIESDVEGRLILKLPWLRPGDYGVDLFACGNGNVILDHFQRACLLRILPALPYAHQASDDAIVCSPVLADFEWQVKS
jgi:lipopolysaccharide transport system ATP-binding protein